MWDLSMLLCVLSRGTCQLSCVPVHIPGDPILVWESDTVYLTIWDLSMLLCVLWDLSAILCTCPGGPVCVPVGPVHRTTFQEDLCSCLFQDDVPVFLRDLSPATRQENIGLDQSVFKSTGLLDPHLVWTGVAGRHGFLPVRTGTLEYT
ncbi:hypothetical protein Bbelb_258860 [Branchiostoma belcheri]|nr:hypothetical protein Bbelb_258860 [Branchiostoma belcheri]